MDIKRIGKALSYPWFWNSLEHKIALMMNPAWKALIPCLRQDEHLALLHTVENLRKEGKRIFPEQEKIFHALTLTEPQHVRCIILGQDPYHGQGQAQGLAFSVPAQTPSKALPPSLKNVFKEIHADIYSNISSYAPSPCLERWASQGVLLLNTVLTVQEGKAHSHAHMGWQHITREILSSLASLHPLAVLLWGKPAQSYGPIFTQKCHEHLILTAPHPSPLSAHRGFFGCRHFSTVNTWLKKHGQTAITW